MQRNTTTFEKSFAKILRDGEGAHVNPALDAIRSTADVHPDDTTSDAVFARAIEGFVTLHRTAIAMAYLRFVLRGWMTASKATQPVMDPMGSFPVAEPPVSF